MADLANTITEAIKSSGFSITGKSTHPSVELAQHIARAIENDPNLAVIPFGEFAEMRTNASQWVSYTAGLRAIEAGEQQ